jgi:hypothetical protein
MTTRTSDISLRQAALITAYSIIVMLLFLLLTAAIQGLTVPGDAAATAKNISENELLFRAGVCGYIVVIILDVLLAWALYVLLKPANASLSLLMGWFRFGYAIIFAFAVGRFFNVLQLISNDDFMTVFKADQLQAEVMLSLNGFELIWQIGYVFFGLHIVFLGYLIVKSGYIPRVLGVLLIIGGSFGYLLESFTSFLFPDYSAIASPGLIAAGIGELALCVWILWKGKNTLETQSKTLNVASLD